MSEETAPPLAVAPRPVEDEGRIDESKRGRLIAVLLAIVLLSEVVPFVFTLAGVVTPLIGASFPSAGNSFTWSITIVGLVGGVTIVLVTKSADLWGKKRMLIVAGLILLIGSFLCAVTSSWALFLVGRGFMGMAIGLSALSYSLIRDIMPRSWVPITIAFVGSGLGVSGVLAPVIAGLLTNHYSWRSIFWFLVIYMVVALLLFAVIVPESRVRLRQRLDVLGTVLLGGGIGAVTLYLSEGSSWGWTGAGNYPYLIGGVVALVAFTWWETKTDHPVIELRLLRSPQLSGLLALAFFFTGVYTVLGYAPSFMFLVGKQQVEGGVLAGAAKASHYPLSVVEKFITFHGNLDYAAGFTLYQLAWHVLVWISIAGIILAPVAAIWARRTKARIPAIVGQVALVLCMAGLIVWHDSWLQVVLFAVLGGAAFGLYNGTTPNMLIDVVPRHQQGISAGLLAASGGIGSAIFTATMTSILVRYQFQFIAPDPKTLKPTVHNIAQVYTSTGWGYVFVFGLIGAVITLGLAVFLRAGRKPLEGGLME
jgi:MFS family permease